MTTPESRFEHELEVFRHEAEAGTQFFYSYLAVHALAARREEIEIIGGDHVVTKAAKLCGPPL